MAFKWCVKRLFKMETFSASKLFALSKRLTHSIYLIRIDLISPFRFLGKKEGLGVMILFPDPDLCSTQGDYGKQNAKFLSSNFVYDIKVLPFSQCVGKNYNF